MRLWLHHPALAGLSCEDCHKWVHDFETGKKKTYRSGPDRVEIVQTWPKGMGPPCKTCPKQSPAKEREHMLSAKNWRTLLLYQQIRLTGATDDERNDRILRRNLATIDALVRNYEHHRLVMDLGHLWPHHK